MVGLGSKVDRLLKLGMRWGDLTWNLPHFDVEWLYGIQSCRAYFWLCVANVRGPQSLPKWKLSLYASLTVVPPGPPYRTQDCSRSMRRSSSGEDAQIGGSATH